MLKNKLYHTHTFHVSLAFKLTLIFNSFILESSLSLSLGAKLINELLIYRVVLGELHLFFFFYIFYFPRYSCFYIFYRIFNEQKKGSFISMKKIALWDFTFLYFSVSKNASNASCSHYGLLRQMPFVFIGPHL